MMRLYTGVLFLLIFIYVKPEAIAQSHEKGTLSFQTNFDLGVHATHYTNTYKGALLESKDDGAATALVMINASYNPLQFLSVGINTGFGSYLEDPDNAEADGNRYRRLGLDIKAYYLNNDKFNMFVGMQIGASGLEINRKVPLIGSLYSTQKYKYSAPYLDIHSGFNWYFANHLGLNMQAGYSLHSFQLKEAYLSGNKWDLNNYDVKLGTRGIRLQLGASIKF